MSFAPMTLRLPLAIRRIALAAMLVVLQGRALAAPAGGGGGLKARLLRTSARFNDRAIRLGGRLIPLITSHRAGGTLEVIVGESLVRGKAQHTLGQRRLVGNAGHGERLELGALVGSGYFGTVYHLKKTPAMVSAEHAGAALVVKLAHAPRWRPLRRIAAWLARKRGRISAKDSEARANAPLATTVRRLQLELDTYGFLHARTARIEAAPSYPKSPAWRRGAVPVAPIVAAAQTDAGPVLVKPLLHGRSPTEIVKRHGKLTPQMKRSLREIYDFVQATAEAIRVAPSKTLAPITELAGKRGQPLSLDVRPHNLLWIEKRKMLRALGLSRPSFVLVEIDQAVGNVGQYLKDRTSFADYLREVERTD